MSLMPNQSATKSSSQPWLVWSLCVLALGLLGWRCIAIFSTPLETQNPHPLSEIISSIVGPGNAQISETASGDVLIVLNGPEGVIEPVIAARLTDITQTISTTGTAPILKQFPFAEQTGFNPTPADLAELSALGLLATLALFLAFHARPLQAEVREATPSILETAARLRSDIARSAMLDEVAPPPFDTAPVLTPIDAQATKAGPRALANAQSFAEANPDVTAKVIERWIRARGFTE